MRRNFCKGKPKKTSIRRKRGPPHREKDHHKKYPPAHGEKDSSLTRQHNLLTPSLPAPGRAPTHDHFRHARSIVNSKHNYMFFYLFIQHLLSALFTNQYALMRCLKYNKPNLQ